MGGLLKDVRFAFRMLVKNPALTAVAVFALAMGIGLTATMFSIVYGAIIKGLPFEDPEEIVHLERSNLPAGIESLGVSIHDYLDWREQQRSFEHLAAFSTGTVNVAGTERAERYSGAFITANGFASLGVSPVRGRLFREDEDDPGADGVVLIGYSVWRDRYGLDESVVGQTVRANGETMTIVGVMPEDFRFPIEQDIWLPLRTNPLDLERGAGTLLEVFGRLRDGVSSDQALLDISGIARRLEADYPDSNEGVGVLIQPYTREFVGGEAVGLLFTMLAAVFLVLIIACANVANLLLARTAARVKEVAVRTALGASRFRVVSQLMMESMALAFVGALLGTGIAWVGIGFFRRQVETTNPPFWMEFGLQPPVVGFVILLGLVAALASGLIPALQASGADVNSILKDESRGSSGFRLGKLSRALVVVEIALSVALLVSAGLMIKSVAQLREAEFGFRIDGIFTARVGLFATDYPDEESRRQFFTELEERLESVPQARSVAISTVLPGNGACCSNFAPEGQTYERDQDFPAAAQVSVTPGFFETFEIPVLRGRTFTREDGPDGLPVAVVNARFESDYFPEGGAIGKRIRLGASDSEEPWLSIVGVVGDAFMHGVGNDQDADGPGLYVPIAQTDQRFVSLAVAVPGDPLAITAAVRDVVTAVDQDTPIYFVNNMEEVLAQNTWFYNVFGALFMVFGAVALFLASIGLYGVMSYSVSRRTPEVGIRMALGAESRDVLRLIMRQGTWQLGLGVVIGLGLALVLARGLQLLLFQVSPFDPVILTVIVAVLVITGTLASFIPARRATRVDPMVAFRYE